MDVLKPGDKLTDNLVIVKELGSGFTGVVLECENPFTQQRCAVKVMRDANEHQLTRLSAEAIALMGLEHDNVVRVHDAGQLADGRGWLRMELLRGSTLGAMLARHPSGLSPLLAIRYILGVAGGVAAAHEISVIHRDLKPDNIFIVAGTNIAKVLDFSGAKHLSADLRTTKPPDMQGTLAYMSAQQINGDTTDGRNDVYAMGLIFWEVLTGKYVFEKYLSNYRLLALAHAGEMPALIAAELGLPACFDRIIQTACAKQPEDRYQTPMAFFQAVLEAKQEYMAEVEAGRIIPTKRPGEPSLNDTDSRQEYVSPKALARPDTAPVEPAVRVTIASRARADSLPDHPRAPDEAGGQEARRGPTGTMRLSEILVLAGRGEDVTPAGAASPRAPRHIPATSVMVLSREASREPDAGASASPWAASRPPVPPGAPPASQVATERLRKPLAEAPSSPRSSPVTPEPMELPPARRRLWPAGIVVVAVLASITCSAGVLWMRGRLGPRPPAELPTAAPSVEPPTVAVVPEPPEPATPAPAVASVVPPPAVSPPTPAPVSSQPPAAATGQPPAGSAAQRVVPVRRAPSPRPAPSRPRLLFETEY